MTRPSLEHTDPLIPFRSGEFELAITPHSVDGFHVQAPGLARALGFRDAYRLMESIPDGEKGYTTACTPGGEQRVGYLTEAGFYRALGQRQPARISDPETRGSVERFQTWVYGTVLPEIRKTGGYGARPDVAAITKADLAKMVLESEEEKAIMAAALESAAPAIAYHERYVANGDAATVKAWGAQFGLTQKSAYQLLLDRKIVYRFEIGERWSNSQRRKVLEYEYRAYAKYIPWFDLRPQHEAPRYHNGQVRSTLYVRQAHALDLAAKCGLTVPEASRA